MDSNSAKCFICDVECASDDRNVGANIARRLTMPITLMFAKCLRTTVDAENEYFCAECAIKIEDYDQLIQLSIQIETELYELYRRKSKTDSCYLLDAEIIMEPDAINDELIQSENLKLENETTHSEPNSTDELNETYDEMVVEYLDDYETQSDDVNLAEEQKVMITVIEESNENGPEQQVISTTPKVVTNKSKRKKISSKGGTATPKPKIKTKPKTEKSNESPESSEDDLKCHRCSFVAENRLELEEHKTIKHIDDIKRLQCDICGRSYKSKSALCVHLGMHNGRNAHECHICGKTFTQRGALVRHMPMHTGEKPHQCDVCGKQFIHYSSFHMHQMIHTNERKKKCTVCGSEFRSNSHMTRHMRSHTGEKPFACPICGQKFAQRYNMKTHYNTHQGIHRPQSRNHKCVICSEAFPRREKLNKHLRQTHRISDADICAIAEHGPDSEITQKIIDRLRANIYTKEEIYVEYVEDVNELISSDPLK